MNFNNIERVVYFLNFEASNPKDIALEGNTNATTTA